MTQQFVTRRMTTGVIDQLELVQVEEHQGMTPHLARQIVQGLFKAILKFPAIGQAGQGIVGGLP